MTSIDDLADKRQELDLSLADVAARLADHHDLAESTLSARVSEWERGDRELTDEDLDALTTTLDEIEEEQNFRYPRCSRCPYVPQIEIKYHEDDPLCLVCYDYLEVTGAL